PLSMGCATTSTLDQRLLNDLDDDEFSGLERSERHSRCHDAGVNPFLRIRRTVAQHIERFVGRGALKRALLEQPQHERLYVDANTTPQLGVVGLENCPLQTAL